MYVQLLAMGLFCSSLTTFAPYLFYFFLIFCFYIFIYNILRYFSWAGIAFSCRCWNLGLVFIISIGRTYSISKTFSWAYLLLSRSFVIWMRSFFNFRMLFFVFLPFISSMFLIVLSINCSSSSSFALIVMVASKALTSFCSDFLYQIYSSPFQVYI